jgi:rhodanese-related sulfurtransferase
MHAADPRRILLLLYSVRMSVPGEHRALVALLCSQVWRWPIRHSTGREGDLYLSAWVEGTVASHDNIQLRHGPVLGPVADVSVKDTWDRLKTETKAVLVDVRTRAEWAFVGLPDLSSLSKRPVLAEWQTFPDNREDPEFVGRLAASLTEAGVEKDATVFFICRSGSRSKRAAEAMTTAGFSHCLNVADGFEGPLDGDRHRGRTGGWKAAGLPWAQG